MGSKICMNVSCGTATTPEWKRGWPLRSGGFADLCNTCGFAYQRSVFCETFHSEQSGWRECQTCSKPLHCGCITSEFLIVLLDYGGVSCSSCVKTSQLKLTRANENSDGFGSSSISTPGDLRAPNVEFKDFHNGITGGDIDSSLLDEKREEFMQRFREVGSGFSKASEPACGLSKLRRPDSNSSVLDVQDVDKSRVQPSLSLNLGESSATRSSDLPFSKWNARGMEQNNGSGFQQPLRSSPVSLQPPKSGVGTPETNRSVASQMRAVRPPVDGRGKNHLLARYLPRITDQELQQLSGDLNSNIVPLFEKVLSASDAGRIGRLVLPKACAEAYFPPINQSEGIPVTIQDIMGKEWTFQFRFWPNNNSRMYVLEGVTSCIQSMQLQAGDTVTFSRIDPGGKLVMGFRKATNSEDQLDSRTSTIHNGSSVGETSSSHVKENLLGMSRSSGLLRRLKGKEDPHINGADGDMSWHDNEKHGCKVNEDSLRQSFPKSEKKRTRNIGSKSKRLLMHSEEALELKLTWAETQDLLRPPHSAKPTIVTIEDHEFEEYDEPPVFGKRTVLTSQPSGEQEQWAQCDDCSKWRRLPADVLLPPKWSCADNVWESNRYSCSMPEEMSQHELENLLTPNRGFMKQRIAEIHDPDQERETSGLDALATAAVLGDGLTGSGDRSPVAATTRHPRHRPGCTCIVCIQPPSGKGKHKPTCTCNVCMTVKRRFRTLMLRKKKRQSEQEVEATNENQNDNQDKSETHKNHADKGRSEVKAKADAAEASSSTIDLNSHPFREDVQPEDAGMSLMSLLQAASLPFENSTTRNGLPSFNSEQQKENSSQPTEKGENGPRCKKH